MTLKKLTAPTVERASFFSSKRTTCKSARAAMEELNKIKSLLRIKVMTGHECNRATLVKNANCFVVQLKNLLTT
jgi:hypothetical protein